MQRQDDQNDDPPTGMSPYHKRTPLPAPQMGVNKFSTPYKNYTQLYFQQQQQRDGHNPDLLDGGTPVSAYQTGLKDPQQSTGPTRREIQASLYQGLDTLNMQYNRFMEHLNTMSSQTTGSPTTHISGASQLADEQPTQTALLMGAGVETNNQDNNNENTTANPALNPPHVPSTEKSITSQIPSIMLPEGMSIDMNEILALVQNDPLLFDPALTGAHSTRPTLPTLQPLTFDTERTPQRETMQDGDDNNNNNNNNDNNNNNNNEEEQEQVETWDTFLQHRFKEYYEHLAAQNTTTADKQQPSDDSTSIENNTTTTTTTSPTATTSTLPPLPQPLTTNGLMPTDQDVQVEENDAAIRYFGSEWDLWESYVAKTKAMGSNKTTPTLLNRTTTTTTTTTNQSSSDTSDLGVQCEINQVNQDKQNNHDKNNNNNNTHQQPQQPQIWSGLDPVILGLQQFLLRPNISTPQQRLDREQQQQQVQQDRLAEEELTYRDQFYHTQQQLAGVFANIHMEELFKSYGVQPEDQQQQQQSNTSNLDDIDSDGPEASPQTLSNSQKEKKETKALPTETPAIITTTTAERTPQITPEDQEFLNIAVAFNNLHSTPVTDQYNDHMLKQPQMSTETVFLPRFDILDKRRKKTAELHQLQLEQVKDDSTTTTTTTTKAQAVDITQNMTTTGTNQQQQQPENEQQQDKQQQDKQNKQQNIDQMLFDLQYGFGGFDDDGEFDPDDMAATLDMMNSALATMQERQPIVDAKLQKQEQERKEREEKQRQIEFQAYQQELVKRHQLVSAEELEKQQKQVEREKMVQNALAPPPFLLRLASELEESKKTPNQQQKTAVAIEAEQKQKQKQQEEVEEEEKRKQQQQQQQQAEKNQRQYDHTSLPQYFEVTLKNDLQSTTTSALGDNYVYTTTHTNRFVQKQYPLKNALFREKIPHHVHTNLQLLYKFLNMNELTTAHIKQSKTQVYWGDYSLVSRFNVLITMFEVRKRKKQQQQQQQDKSDTSNSDPTHTPSKRPQRNVGKQYNSTTVDSTIADMIHLKDHLYITPYQLFLPELAELYQNTIDSHRVAAASAASDQSNSTPQNKGMSLSKFTSALLAQDNRTLFGHSSGTSQQPSSTTTTTTSTNAMLSMYNALYKKNLLHQQDTLRFINLFLLFVHSNLQKRKKVYVLKKTFHELNEQKKADEAEVVDMTTPEAEKLSKKEELAKKEQKKQKGGGDGDDKDDNNNKNNNNNNNDDDDEEFEMPPFVVDSDLEDDTIPNPFSMDPTKLPTKDQEMADYTEKVLNLNELLTQLYTPELNDLYFALTPHPLYYDRYTTYLGTALDNTSSYFIPASQHNNGVGVKERNILSSLLHFSQQQMQQQAMQTSLRGPNKPTFQLNHNISHLLHENIQKLQPTEYQTTTSYIYTIFQQIPSQDVQQFLFPLFLSLSYQETGGDPKMKRIFDMMQSQEAEGKKEAGKNNDEKKENDDQYSALSYNPSVWEQFSNNVDQYYKHWLKTVYTPQILPQKQQEEAEKRKKSENNNNNNHHTTAANNQKETKTTKASQTDDNNSQQQTTPEKCSGATSEDDAAAAAAAKMKFRTLAGGLVEIDVPLDNAAIPQPGSDKSRENMTTNTTDNNNPESTTPSPTTDTNRNPDDSTNDNPEGDGVAAYYTKLRNHTRTLFQYDEDGEDKSPENDDNNNNNNTLFSSAATAELEELHDYFLFTHKQCICSRHHYFRMWLNEMLYVKQQVEKDLFVKKQLALAQSRGHKVDPKETPEHKQYMAQLYQKYNTFHNVLINKNAFLFLITLLSCDCVLYPNMFLFNPYDTTYLTKHNQEIQQYQDSEIKEMLERAEKEKNAKQHFSKQQQPQQQDTNPNNAPHKADIVLTPLHLKSYLIAQTNNTNHIALQSIYNFDEQEWEKHLKKQGGATPSPAQQQQQQQTTQTHKYIPELYLNKPLPYNINSILDNNDKPLHQLNILYNYYLHQNQQQQQQVANNKKSNNNNNNNTIISSLYFTPNPFLYPTTIDNTTFTTPLLPAAYTTTALNIFPFRHINKVPLFAFPLDVFANTKMTPRQQLQHQHDMMLTNISYQLSAPNSQQPPSLGSTPQQQQQQRQKHALMRARTNKCFMSFANTNNYNIAYNYNYLPAYQQFVTLFYIAENQDLSLLDTLSDHKTYNEDREEFFVMKQQDATTKKTGNNNNNDNNNQNAALPLTTLLSTPSSYITHQGGFYIEWTFDHVLHRQQHFQQQQQQQFLSNMMAAQLKNATMPQSRYSLTVLQQKTYLSNVLMFNRLIPSNLVLGSCNTLYSTTLDDQTNQQKANATAATEPNQTTNSFVISLTTGATTLQTALHGLNQLLPYILPAQLDLPTHLNSLFDAFQDSAGGSNGVAQRAIIQQQQHIAYPHDLSKVPNENKIPDPVILTQEDLSLFNPHGNNNNNNNNNNLVGVAAQANGNPVYLNQDDEENRDVLDAYLKTNAVHYSQIHHYNEVWLNSDLIYEDTTLSDQYNAVYDDYQHVLELIQEHQRMSRYQPNDPAYSQYIQQLQYQQLPQMIKQLKELQNQMHQQQRVGENIKFSLKKILPFSLKELSLLRTAHKYHPLYKKTCGDFSKYIEKLKDLEDLQQACHRDQQDQQGGEQQTDQQKQQQVEQQQVMIEQRQYQLQQNEAQIEAQLDEVLRLQNSIPALLQMLRFVLTLPFTTTAYSLLSIYERYELFLLFLNNFNFQEQIFFGNQQHQEQDATTTTTNNNNNNNNDTALFVPPAATSEELQQQQPHRYLTPLRNHIAPQQNYLFDAVTQQLTSHLPYNFAINQTPHNHEMAQHHQDDVDPNNPTHPNTTLSSLLIHTYLLLGASMGKNVWAVFDGLMNTQLTKMLTQHYLQQQKINLYYFHQLFLNHLVLYVKDNIGHHLTTTPRGSSLDDKMAALIENKMSTTTQLPDFPAVVQHYGEMLTAYNINLIQYIQQDVGDASADIAVHNHTYLNNVLNKFNLINYNTKHFIFDTTSHVQDKIVEYIAEKNKDLLKNQEENKNKNDTNKTDNDTNRTNGQTASNQEILINPVEAMNEIYKQVKEKKQAEEEEQKEKEKRAQEQQQDEDNHTSAQTRHQKKNQRNAQKLQQQNNNNNAILEADDNLAKLAKEREQALLLEAKQKDTFFNTLLSMNELIYPLISPDLSLQDEAILGTHYYNKYVPSLYTVIEQRLVDHFEQDQTTTNNNNKTSKKTQKFKNEMTRQNYLDLVTQFTQPPTMNPTPETTPGDGEKAVGKKNTSLSLKYPHVRISFISAPQFALNKTVDDIINLLTKALMIIKRIQTNFEGLPVSPIAQEVQKLWLFHDFYKECHILTQQLRNNTMALLFHHIMLLSFDITMERVDITGLSTLLQQSSLTDQNKHHAHAMNNTSINPHAKTLLPGPNGQYDPAFLAEVGLGEHDLHSTLLAKNGVSTNKAGIGGKANKNAVDLMNSLTTPHPPAQLLLQLALMMSTTTTSTFTHSTHRK